MLSKPRYLVKIDSEISEVALNIILLIALHAEVQLLNDKIETRDILNKKLNVAFLDHGINDLLTKQAWGRILYVDRIENQATESLIFDFSRAHFYKDDNVVQLILNNHIVKDDITYTGQLLFESGTIMGMLSISANNMNAEASAIFEKLENFGLKINYDKISTPMLKAPYRIAQNLMLEQDRFSNLLNMQLIEVEEGKATVQMSIDDRMLNGFGICHGGVMFSLADSAFAFASNSHGRKAVSIETSMTNVKVVNSGNTLTATAKEINLTYKLGTYIVDIYNENSELVAIFKGTAYRKSEEWMLD